MSLSPSQSKSVASRKPTCPIPLLEHLHLLHHLLELLAKLRHGMLEKAIEGIHLSRHLDFPRLVRSPVQRHFAFKQLRVVLFKGDDGSEVGGVDQDGLDAEHGDEVLVGGHLCDLVPDGGHVGSVGGCLEAHRLFGVEHGFFGKRSVSGPLFRSAEQNHSNQRCCF